MLIRSYEKKDLKEMTVIWNEVVADGIAFPQEDILDETTGAAFFAEQSYCGVATDDNGSVVGLYILHPNNIGQRSAYRRKACAGLHGTGKKARLHDPSIQCGSRKQYPRQTPV